MTVRYYLLGGKHSSYYWFCLRISSVVVCGFFETHDLLSFFRKGLGRRKAEARKGMGAVARLTGFSSGGFSWVRGIWFDGFSFGGFGSGV